MSNGTQVWCCSDDLTEISGDVKGEVCDGRGCTLTFSDGTVLKTRYGEPHDGCVWSITLMVMGTLFDRIEQCYAEGEHKNADGSRNLGAYSDVAHFKPGITFATKRGKCVTC